MKGRQTNLTYKSIQRFIKQTNVQPDGRDAEGKRKFKPLRETQISFDDMRVEKK